MAQLRRDYQSFSNQSTTIIVVGPENQDQFKKYWSENDLPFIGVPNPDHSVLKQFGQEVNLFKLGRMPAQVILDQKGMVRYAHYGHGMSDIPDNEEILAVLQAINHEAFQPA
jgi:peroxiredoxin Q/BCP